MQVARLTYSISLNVEREILIAEVSLSFQITPGRTKPCICFIVTNANQMISSTGALTCCGGEAGIGFIG